MLFGYHFTLLTDNKPLLFGSKKGILLYWTSWLQQWAIILLGYRTIDFGQAHTLSFFICSQLLLDDIIEDQFQWHGQTWNDLTGKSISDCQHTLDIPRAAMILNTCGFCWPYHWPLLFGSGQCSFQMARNFPNAYTCLNNYSANMACQKH